MASSGKLSLPHKSHNSLITLIYINYSLESANCNYHPPFSLLTKGVGCSELHHLQSVQSIKLANSHCQLPKVYLYIWVWALYGIRNSFTFSCCMCVHEHTSHTHTHTHTHHVSCSIIETGIRFILSCIGILGTLQQQSQKQPSSRSMFPERS